MIAHKPGADVFERVFHRWRTETTRRMTLGEYPIYDEYLYRWMIEDEVRTGAYRNAIESAARGKHVLDLGTGAEALLAIMAARAGALHVDAFEVMPASADAARRRVAALGLSDIITVHCGSSTEIVLPHRVDLCVSEIIGMIGSAEGALAALQDAHRFLAPDGRMLPKSCTTLFAPAFHPDGYYSDADTESVSRYYRDRIFDAVGHAFSPSRIAVLNFPNENIVGEPQVFERMDFGNSGVRYSQPAASFTVAKDARVDGFVLWVELEVDSHNVVNTWSGTSWAPVMLDCDPFEISAGDVIKAECVTSISGNGINPDYTISGSLYRDNAAISQFRIYWPHIGRALAVGSER